MDGQYLNKIIKSKSKIDSWIGSVIDDQQWQKYYDLHIDDIDDLFEQKKFWIEGAFFFLSYIKSEIQSKSFDVLLVVSLKVGDKTMDISDLNTWDKVRNELGYSPPSFYVFPVKSEFIAKTIKDSVELNLDVKGIKVSFKEEKEDDEFYRTLYIR